MATTVAGLTPTNFEKLRQAVITRESGGNYSQPGNQYGYIGGYQMGAQALETVGYLRPGTSKLGNAALRDPSNWTGKDGMRSSQDFLKNSQVQDKAFQNLTEVNYRTLSTVKTPTGALVLNSDSSQAQVAGYLGAAHQNGAGSVINQGLGKTDGNGQTGSAAYKNAANAVGNPNTTVASDQTGPNQNSNPTIPSTNDTAVANNVLRGGSVEDSELTKNFTSITVSGSSAESSSGEKTPLPIPNPLESFISSNALFTLSSLSSDDVNFPEDSYRKGYLGRIIFSGAGRYSEDRASTAYQPKDNPSGKYDYFIDNVEIFSLISPLTETKGTNSVTINFEVTEPYSMGQFLQSCQIASFANLHKDYTQAPFLLTVEFKGYTTDNKSDTVPYTTRYLPIKMTSINMTVGASGCKYQVKSIAWNEFALLDNYNILKQDTAISGETVATMLQSGPTSLENIINVRLAEIAKDSSGSRTYTPDEVTIIFPKDVVQIGKETQEDQGAVQENKPGSGTPAGNDVKKRISLTRNPKTNLFEQAQEEISDLGNSKFSFDLTRGGANPKQPDDGNEPNSDFKVAALPNKKIPRNIIAVNEKDREFTFRKGTSIINAITEIMLMSDYCTKAVTEPVTDKHGFYDWFRIETQAYLLKPDEKGNAQVNIHPKLLVFRVVPYKIHSSLFSSPNGTAKGYQQLINETVKHYDYIYTGKNVDVLDFKLTMNNDFATKILADGLGKYSESALMARLGRSSAGPDTSAPYDAKPQGNEGYGDEASGYARQSSLPDRWRNSDGGGDADTYKTLVAKVFQSRILNSNSEKVVADLEILGDPYYIADSGLGNFTNTNSSDRLNITSTRAMDYQSSEVDILFKFFTPVDINPGGTMTFPKDIDNQLEIPFSGLYKVWAVKSKFSSGKFTQSLQLLRRPNQNQIPFTADVVTQKRDDGSTITTDKVTGAVSSTPAPDDMVDLPEYFGDPSQNDRNYIQDPNTPQTDYA
jgi:hypothetical protein